MIVLWRYYVLLLPLNIWSKCTNKPELALKNDLFLSHLFIS